MSRRIFNGVLCLTALLISAGVVAQSFNRDEVEMFHTLRQLSNPLARHQYLVQLMPHLSDADKQIAEQYVSFSLDELGVYNQDVLSFPLKSAQPGGLVLPTQAEWEGADAVDLIAKLAADRQIVMINEAHHDAHTRVLTLALLPRLRALGFTYFVAEAIGNDDPGLMQRGYPVKASGTEYLQEPLYGEIVREAIRLGFKVVPYDSSSNDQETRDAVQAGNLFRKVFARDPHARLFVDAGYAHIDKAKGRLGNIEPMAAQLARLTGLDPLSIDQTQFLETGFDTSDDYHVLVRRFPSQSPVVLINRATGKPWSALPQLYDLNVILPPTLSMRAFGKDATNLFEGAKLKSVDDPGRLAKGAFTVLDDMQRPTWVALGGQRIPFPISTELCRAQTPCVVDAHYLHEPDDATAADRYAFMKNSSRSKLFLRPGDYRLRAWNANGTTLSERDIHIARP